MFKSLRLQNHRGHFSLIINMSWLMIVLIVALIPLVARADECDVKAAKLTEAIPGVSAERNHPTISAADAIDLATAAASEPSIDCPTKEGFPIDLFVGWNGGFPPGSFYDFTARAGHIVVGAAEKDIRDGATLCQ